MHTPTHTHAAAAAAASPPRARPPIGATRFVFQMEMCETRGLPKAIQDEVRKVQCCNYYGLFPEIHRAYITVDNHLYLWDYDHGTR